MAKSTGFLFRLTAFAAVLAYSSISTAQTPQSVHPGEQIYQTVCAFCHAGGDARAASLRTLQSMTAEMLEYTLTEGLMSAQASGLTDEQRAAVIDYLAAERPDNNWISNNICSDQHQSVSLASIKLAGAGVDAGFSRNLSAEQAGLNKADLHQLELAWAIGFPNITGLRSSPVISDNTLFYPAGATGYLLALDTQTGCIKWSYDAGAALRASAAISEPQDNGQRYLIITDEQARLHALDPVSGTLLWQVAGEVDEGVATRLTGAPLPFEDRLYVPVSASGVARGAEAEHECCDGRGAVTALDITSGQRLWTYVTMPPAAYTGAVNSAGARLRGPSGAPIWSSPSLDVKRRLLYVTTGENTSLPATDTSNAIIALDIDTGEVRWQFQAIANDVWNMACSGRNPGPNCPAPEDSIRKDWDFGSAATLVQLPDGSERLLAGQKSGHLWALNPDDGAVLWQQRIGEGGALGGNHWGIAVDNTKVLLPISDPNGANRTDDVIRSGIYAFDIATGRADWEYRARPDCDDGRAERVASCAQRYGFSAMPLVIDGALVAGNIDGRLFIFDNADGRILFEFDTSDFFDTVNGIEARGGSIDAHSIAAGAGMVFVGSGYERFSQQAGNVLLAFKVKP
ncbi:MAG: PQQ-binding-like beta-propeller repeat protein [Pseudohongiella sp.]|nr:PQQ-binding-like beta-propeller repeat protein [Pseudohongiella sp.]